MGQQQVVTLNWPVALALHCVKLLTLIVFDVNTLLYVLNNDVYVIVFTVRYIGYMIFYVKQ